MAGTRQRSTIQAPAGTRVAIVAARFHGELVEQLCAGARRALEAAGVRSERVVERWVPGAWELPLAAQRAAEDGGFAAVVALGCVIRGGTPHFEYVAGECTRGLMQVQLATGIPVAFGVLTVDDRAQAEERADPTRMDKGGEAAQAALEMIVQATGAQR